MEINDYLTNLGIDYKVQLSEDGNYVIDIPNSDAYGKIYSKLDKSEDLDQIEDNVLLTEQGSSIMYESESEPILLNLIADWEGDIYQLIINNIEDM